MRSISFYHRHYWAIMSLVYGVLAFLLLWFLIPISVDGGGPSATFYWGSHPPAVTFTQYYQQWGVRLQFLYPYIIASIIVIVIGCCITTVVVHRFWHRNHLFAASFVVSLILLLFAAAISDVGTTLHFWRGPVMYQHLYSVALILKVSVPLSLASGALVAIRNGLAENLQ